jgi:hypothetical protein
MTVKRPFIELTYYETYYFANIVKNVLEEQFAYLRLLDEFYGDHRYFELISPFPRFSAFHRFIRFLIDHAISDDSLSIKLDILQDEAERFNSGPGSLVAHPSKLPVNLAFDRFGIAHESFENWLKARGISFVEARDDDMQQYYDDLRLEGQIDELLDRATAEVFFVLFQNRHALLLFNEMIAGLIERSDEDRVLNSEFAPFFARSGVLRRVAIPSWVQRAVFFRDRGICVLCAADLSGILAIGSEDNFDHVVALAAGGLNDVSNVQLLCRACNAKKSAGDAITSNRYEAWYPERD